jgi:hypothetical protein
MNIKHRIMGVGCGALAGLTGSFVVALCESSFDFSIPGLYELLHSLQIIGSVGIIVGVLMGAYMTARMQERIWRLQNWVGMGLLSGILSLSHWLVFVLLLWLGAQIGISSAGVPSEAIRSVVMILIIGGMAGSTGGIVGGFIFTRYASRLQVD